MAEDDRADAEGSGLGLPVSLQEGNKNVDSQVLLELLKADLHDGERSFVIADASRPAPLCVLMRLISEVCRNDYPRSRDRARDPLRGKLRDGLHGGAYFGTNEREVLLG